MARAITSPELVKLRSNNQFSELYLAIHKPAIVFQALINQTFTTLDKVIQITYDTVTFGAYTDILPGQTLWIGSSAGARDIGRVRVRKTPTATVLYIGETSDVAFANNLFLTVVDEVGLWARHIRVDENLISYMDWDISYSNQHTAFAPVPVMGPPAPVWLTGASVTVPFNASESWDFLGAVTYSWAFPGASATTGLTTATPTATYNAAGTYRAALTVTRGGVSTTGYRFVFVYDAAHMPVTQFTIGSCSGDYQRGGWEFDVTLYAEADIADVQEGAQVILFAKDYYNNVQESLGPVSGRENIIAVGWIDTEDLDINPVAGTVTFTVKGPQYWINRMPGFPTGIQNTTAAPAAWTDMQNLTVDKMLFSFLYYRSTVFTAMDCTLTGDTRVAASLEAPVGSLWTQLVTIGDETIFARPACDRYGRMFVQINPQYTPTADRGSIPTVMTLTKPDYEGRLNVNRTPHSSISRVELSGIATINNTANSFFSLANGHVFKRYGMPLQKERVLLTSQAQANALAGLVLEKENIIWNFDFTFAENNRFIDIAPAQYLDIPVIAGDSPRGVAYSGHTFPRSVSLDFRADSNALFWAIQAEQATSDASITQNGDIPVTDAGGAFLPSFSPPSFPPIPRLPPIPALPPISITGGVSAKNVWITTSVGVFYTSTFDQASPTWVSANGGLSTADKSKIATAQVNKFGQLLINVTPSGSGGERLYYAPFGGQMALVQSSSLYFLLFSFTPYFYHIATNPYLQDVFYFTIGDTTVTKIYSLNVTNNTPTFIRNFAPDIPEDYQSVGNINYITGGKWIMTLGATIFNNQYVVRLSNDLLTAEYVSASLGGFGGGWSYSTPAAGQGNFVYLPAKNSIISSSGAVVTALPAGTTMGNLPQGIAADPTGQVILMQSTAGATAQKSVNGGSSFSTVTFPQTPNHSAIQCLDTSTFIWATGSVSSLGNSKVFLTTDGGATFIDKTGNLRDVSDPNFQPVTIQAVV